MSIIRFLFLSHLLNNFDKVAGRIIFLLVYSYVLPLVVLALNEGVVWAFAHKNPIDVYMYSYKVVSFYYNNTSALTYGRVLYLIMICLTTYWIQSFIWGIGWKNLPRKIGCLLINLIVNVIKSASGRIESEKYETCNKNMENGIVLAKSQTLEKVEASLEKVIIAIFSARSSGISLSHNKIMMLREEVSNDIASAVGNFIEVLVKAHERMDNRKQSKKEN